MTCSRREIALLLPAVAAAQEKPQKAMLPSKSFKYEDLPVKENGQNKQRAVLNGATHSGFAVEMHLTELGPGRRRTPPQARPRRDGAAPDGVAGRHDRGQDNAVDAGLGGLCGVE